jgi:quercetin dioxygenase-like cupin family protein
MAHARNAREDCAKGSRGAHGGPAPPDADHERLVLRINSFPPESEAVRTMTPADSLRVFEGLGNPKAATFGKGGRHPMMHRTESIDYALILSGEITMLLDDEEVLLKAGDVVVQCGTNHAWSNRSNAPCLVAFILIDGEFDPQLETKFETST